MAEGQVRWCVPGLAIALVAALAVPARAGDEVAREPLTPAADPVDPAPLGTGAALVPGFLFHGAGHWVAGDRATARRLFALEGISLAVAGAGAVPLLSSGASRWVSGPSIALSALGIGGFLVSWAADVYGAAGGGGLGGRPDPVVATGRIELGYGYVGDPQFAYTHFATAAVDWQLDRWRVSPRLWTAVDADNQRWRGELVRRFYGPGLEPAGDGSYFEAGMAATYHRYGDDGFAVAGGELFATARQDLGGLGRRLAGSFAGAGFGIELERTHYADDNADLAPQLLLRFGFGSYLGRPEGVHGEVELFYEHRRDGFAGGLGLSRSGGWFGHFGVAAALLHPGGWGLTGQVEAGAALVASLALVRELGRPGRPR